MAHDIEHLKREIEALEKQISSHPFEGLFDRKRLDQLQDKLKKKRKELARLESEGNGDEMETHPDHLEIPEFVPGMEVTPDLGPDFPVGLDADEPHLKPGAHPSPGAKLGAKPATKKVAKPAAKVTTKAKAPTKPKPKAKPVAKKAAKKPAKKKSKR